MGITVNTKALETYERLFKNVPKDQHKKALSEWGKKGGDARSNNYRNVMTANQYDKIIENWIYQSWNLAMRNIAHQIQEDIKNQYHDEVRRFYQDFGRPFIYDRTYSLFGAYRPVFHHKGNMYYIGAKISGEYILDDPYYNLFTSADGKYVRGESVDPNYVFNLFYEKGQHGADIKMNDQIIYKAEDYNTSPTPKEAMKTWWESYKQMLTSELNNMIDKEMQKAMSHNQSLLRKG